MVKRWALSVSGVCAFGLAHAPPALAQVAGGFEVQVPQVRNYVGLAIGAAPDHPGSDDYTLGIAPAALFHFSSGSELYLRIIATEISVNLLDNKSLNFGPKLNLRMGRDDVKDSVVKRMKDIDHTVEAGGFASWKLVSEHDPRQRISISFDVLQDIGSEHDGYLASGSFQYFRPIGRAFTLTAGVSTTYASDGYTSTYFGVNASDAAASGLPTYNAGEGFRDVRFSLGGIISFSQSWHLAMGLIYSRMLGDAADSPVVDVRGSKNQLFGFVGLAYAW